MALDSIKSISYSIRGGSRGQKAQACFKTPHCFRGADDLHCSSWCDIVLPFDAHLKAILSVHWKFIIWCRINQPPKINSSLVILIPNLNLGEGLSTLYSAREKGVLISAIVPAIPKFRAACSSWTERSHPNSQRSQHWKVLQRWGRRRHRLPTKYQTCLLIKNVYSQPEQMAFLRLSPAAVNAVIIH